MNLKNIEITSKKIIELIFNLIIIVLFSNPLLLIIYTRFLGINLQNLITMNPYWNILFIKSFVTPFIGFYIMQLKEQLINDGEVETVVLYLFFVAIGLLIMENLTFSIFVLILISYLFYQRKIRVEGICHYIKNTKFSVKDWLAPIGLLAIATLIRIMLILVSNS